MSSCFFSLTPEPFDLGAMGPDDVDGSWLVDCTLNMTRRGTSIVAIGTPVVQRRDQLPLSGGDPTVGSQTIVSVPTQAFVNGEQTTIEPGYGFFFMVTTHGNTGTYQIGFPLILLNGDQITRWALLPVIATPG
jgi:hypothetical protein